MSAEPERAPDAPEEREGRDEPRSAGEADAPLCDLCGHPMLERHCKLVCLNCGYRRDCSDP